MDVPITTRYSTPCELFPGCVTDSNRNRAALVPLLRRANAAAEAEFAPDHPIHVGVASDDRLVMAADTVDPANHDRWLASDTYCDVVLHA